MPPVLFIDLWPEIRGDGIWQERFAAVPAAAFETGTAITVQHFTALDVNRLVREPPRALMLSGSPYNLVDDPALDPVDGVPLERFAALTAVLAALPAVPVLAICFGHQYLNRAAGGTLGRMPATRSEPAWPVEVLAQEPLLAGLDAPRLVESHGWRVETPGDGYAVTARSSDGIEAVRHRDLPRVGFQFHPEYHRRDGATSDGHRVLLNWFGSLPR